MRAAWFLFALSGCVYFDSDSGDDAAPPPIDDTLPPGVWEPAPGAHVYAASVAADGVTLWWATGRREHPYGDAVASNDVWLHATSDAGDELTTPQLVAPRGEAIWEPGVAVTSAGVVAQADTLVRRFTRDGRALGDVQRVSLGTDVRATSTELAVTADGHAQYVATLGNDMREVAVVDLDDNTLTLIGTRDTMEPGGSSSSDVSAAARADGSLLVAWSRYYNGCISTKPSQTLTAVDGANVTSVRDDAGSEFRPAVATSGDGAYIAWQTEGRIVLARHADPTTVIAELGPGVTYQSTFVLALSGPNRGALAWLGDDGALHVQGFVDEGAVVMLTDEERVSPVGTAASTLVDLVHVGEGRYVVAWIEAGGYVTPRAPDRLFATERTPYLSSLRPAPPLAPAAAPLARPLRCP